jgi:hypothetical protein
MFVQFGVHFSGCGIAASSCFCPLFVYLSKSRRRWFCGGCWVRLWRRARFLMLYCR